MSCRCKCDEGEAIEGILDLGGEFENVPTIVYEAVERLNARLAAAEKDASRYRWLRDKANPSWVEHTWHAVSPQETDAEVDAAIAAGDKP